MVQGCLALFLFFSTLSPIPKLSGYILSWLVGEFMLKVLSFSNWFFLRQLLYLVYPAFLDV